MKPHVTIVGAGVIGLACAAQLVRRGHPVALVDPSPPGEQCSLGNAGCLSRASFVPLGMPGMWKKAAGWLLDPDAPFAVPAGYAHRIAPWLWRLHRQTRRDRIAAIADALHPLLDPCVDKWRELAAWAGVPALIRQDGYAFVYESETAFQGDALGRKLRTDRGVRIEVMTGDAIRDFDPVITPRATHMVWLPEQGHCLNPLGLSRALAGTLRQAGAKFVQARATGFDMAGGRVAAVLTDQGPIDTQAVVVAAGAHSRPLAAQLGARVMLETERGYHAMLRSPSHVPRVPVMSGEGKFFVTPMEEGLRVAGTVELAGLAAPPDYRRADLLQAGARKLIPGLQWEDARRWMGHRPSLPDSKPVIGRAGTMQNAYLAFGHGHVGLTAAPATGEIIGALVGGEPPAIDARPFAADRPAIRG